MDVITDAYLISDKSRITDVFYFFLQVSLAEIWACVIKGWSFLHFLLLFVLFLWNSKK